MRWTWTAVLALVAGCDGIQFTQPHAALTRSVPVPAGGDCAHGGHWLQAGVDQDGNGVLDDGEVTSTQQVCATPLPDVLVHTATVPPGEQCALGGQVSRAGHDTNGNGQLEDEEVTREVYGCTEPQRVLARVRPYPGSSQCEPGTARVEAGLDLDGDNELDDTELRTQLELCADTSEVLLRLFPEPAGIDCPLGGTRVRAGVDTNRDAALGDDEPTREALVCQFLRTHPGDYVVRNAADLAALQGISRIRGSLLLQNTSLGEAVLPSLVVVEDRLSAVNNAQLTRLELPGLRLVGQDLSVDSNAQLEVLVLGGGEGKRLPVGQDLSVSYNPRLQVLSGLSFVAPHKGLYLRDNDALQHEAEQPGFSSIEALTGNLMVSGNDSLASLPFSNLTHVGGFVRIEASSSLTSLKGLNSLRTVGGNIEIADNGALESLEGLQRLGAVVGWLSILRNDALRTTEGLRALVQVGSLIIHDNSALEAVGDMPRLESVSTLLEVRHHPKLLGVRNLAALRDVQVLHVEYNALLTGLTGLAGVRHLDLLFVRGNSALASLADLSSLSSMKALRVQENTALTGLGLGALQQVSQEFTVTSNPWLPTCQATMLAAEVFTGEPGRLRIEGNDTTATCGN